jgi:stage II sporulation protein D
MRRTVLALCAVVAALAGAAPAHAASNFTIKGAGFGHGVGMSQFGALGLAQHGSGYRDILRHYYSDTGLGQVATGRVVRVLLRSPKTASFTGATKAGNRTLHADKVYRVTAQLDGTMVLRSATNRRLATFPAPLQVTGDGLLTLRGPATNGIRDGQYRGWLEFRPNAVGNVLAINAIGLEQYLAGVVAAESPASWPAAALEAQAVAARTYAITTNAGGGSGFEQYADTRSQMYQGVRAERPSTNAAINATRSQIVTYNGQPVITYFFSTSGGRTENVEESVLGNTPRPWLRSVDDPYDNVSPWHRWTVRMTMGQASKKLRGLVKGKFRGIVVVERGASPRIRSADVVGSKGRTRVTGATLRRKLELRDTWASFKAITADEDTSTAKAARTSHVIAGRVTPARRGDEVAIERRVRGHWRIASVARVGAAGAYRVSVPGAGLYRVLSHGVAGPTLRLI